MSAAPPTSPTVPADRVSPWLYIPTLYLPFGVLDYGLKVALPGGLFKLLGVSNEQIGLLSGIGLVASLRFVFAPWLDAAASKRRLSLVTLVVGAAFAAIAAGLIRADLPLQTFLWGMVAALFGLALTAASHETAADGYYIRALDPGKQAEFIGIKTAAIRGGIIFSTAVLMLYATYTAAAYGAVDATSEDKTGFRVGFSRAYFAAAGLFLAFAVWNRFTLPKIPDDTAVKHDGFPLVDVLKDYLKQRRVGVMITLFLVYRVGQGVFDAMKNPFYLDPLGKGGMGVEATALPYFSFLSDLPWMIIGGIAGGYLIKAFGLRRTFIPLALLMNLPNLFYAWLAWEQPTAAVGFLGTELNLGVLVGSSLESLGYGLSFSAMFFYMHIMATEAGKNKTAVLAVSLAVMNVGWMLPQMISGFLATALGYGGLFLLSSFVGLVSLLVIPLLPMPGTANSARTPA